MKLNNDVCRLKGEKYFITTSVFYNCVHFMYLCRIHFYLIYSLNFKELLRLRWKYQDIYYKNFFTSCKPSSSLSAILLKAFAEYIRRLVIIKVLVFILNCLFCWWCFQWWWSKSQDLWSGWSALMWRLGLSSQTGRK